MTPSSMGAILLCVWMCVGGVGGEREREREETEANATQFNKPVWHMYLVVDNEQELRIQYLDYRNQDSTPSQ